MSESTSSVPPRSRRDFALHVLPALAWASLIFIGGGLPSPAPEVDAGLPLDKLAHFVAFLVMQLFAYRALRYAFPEPSRSRQAWLGALVSSALGVLLELFQLGVPHRSAELSDIVADCLGAAVGALLVRRP